MVEILDRELEKLTEKKHKAELEYADTGHDKYWKVIQKCEEQINAINKLIENGKSTIMKEYEFSIIIKNIKSKVRNLRFEYPHEDGLRMLENCLDGDLSKPL